MIWLIKAGKQISQQNIFHLCYLEKYYMGAAYITVQRGSLCLVLQHVMVESRDGTMMAVGQLYFQNPMLGAPVHIPKWPIQVASLSVTEMLII